MVTASEMQTKTFCCVGMASADSGACANEHIVLVGLDITIGEADARSRVLSRWSGAGAGLLIHSISSKPKLLQSRSAASS